MRPTGLQSAFKLARRRQFLEQRLHDRKFDNRKKNKAARASRKKNR